MKQTIMSGADRSWLLTYAMGMRPESQYPDYEPTEARRDKTAEILTRMFDLKNQQARAPKKPTPSRNQLLDQESATTEQQIDAPVRDLYGLTEEEIRTTEGGCKCTKET